MMTPEQLEEECKRLDNLMQSLVAKYQDIDRKLYDYKNSTERVNTKLEQLLDHLNLNLEWVSGWVFSKKRRYFK